MAFIDGYTKMFNENIDPNMVVGNNGTLAHTTLGVDLKSQLAEIFQWMRGTPDTTIRSTIKELIARAFCAADQQTIVDLFKLVLFIREPRKGKGERDVTYSAILELYNTFPVTVRFLITNLKDFGYYGDLEMLWKLAQCDKLKSFIIILIANTLQNDQTKLADGTTPSLMAKWAPTEKGNKVLAYNVAKKIFPLIRGSKLFQAYRKLLTSLRAKSDLVEIHLCNRTTCDIKPGSIPSKAATVYSKALRNLQQSVYPKAARQPKSSSRKERERFVDGHVNHIDRSQCKINIESFIANGGEIQAKVADLYSIVRDIFDGGHEDPIRQSQWDARIREIQTKIEYLKIENPSYKHPNILSVVDLSGSMFGSINKDNIMPIIAAIMLGLFTSVIQDTPLNEDAAPFANCFFGFSSEPQLFKLPRTSQANPTKRATLYESITEMRKYMASGYWGQSTNLNKVFQRILQTGIQQKLRPDQMPQIIAIYSDMQFDLADNSFNKTMHQQIMQMYTEASYDMPTVIYWDLNRSIDQKHYPVKADAPGTICLSGFSTRMLDLFLDSSVDELRSYGAVETSPNKVDIIAAVTTTELLSTLKLLDAALHHEMFTNINDELVTVINKELTVINSEKNYLKLKNYLKFMKAIEHLDTY